MSSARLPVIDAHQHVWDVAARPQPWLESAEELAPLRRRFGADDLCPLAERAGVVATVVVQTVTEPGETPELLALTIDDPQRAPRAAAADPLLPASPPPPHAPGGAEAGRPPLVRAVVGWTDLTAPDVADAIARLRELPGGPALAGIRHPLLTEPHPGWISRPDVRRGLAALGAAGLTFDLVLPPAMLPVAVSAAAANPGTVFVLDHLGNAETGSGGVDADWAAQLRAFARQPNTVAKLSGLLGDIVPAGIEASAKRLRPWRDVALAAFGPARLMFGSDWPVCTLTASYEEVVAVARELVSDLNPAEQAAVLAGTAQRVYRIGATAPGTRQ